MLNLFLKIFDYELYLWKLNRWGMYPDKYLIFSVQEEYTDGIAEKILYNCRSSFFYFILLLQE